MLNLPIRLLTAVVLLRYLSRQDYGTYRIVLDMSSVLIYVVSMGFQHAISRFVPELVEKKNYGAVTRLVAALAVVRLLVVVLVLSALIAFWNDFAAFFNIPPGLMPYLWVVVIFILLQRTTEVFGQYFHTAVLDLRAVTIHDTARDLIFILCIIFVSMADLELVGVLLSLVACEIFSSLFYGTSMILHGLRFRKRVKENRLEKAPLEWKRISRYAFYNMFYTFSGLAVGLSLDSFVIARFRGMSEVALYTFALSIMNMVHSFNPLILFKAIFHNVFIRKYSRNQDKGELAFGLTFCTKLGLFVGLPSVLGLCVLADPVIRYVFKADYLGSVTVLYIFAAMFLLRYLTFGLIAVVNTLELVKYLLFLYILAAYNLVAAIILVQVWGIEGVAVATGSTELLWLLFLCFIVGRKAGVRVRFFDKPILRVLVNSAVMLAFCWLALGYVTGIVTLVLTVVAAGCIYLVSSYFNKPFTAEERELINGLLKKRLWVF